jgi:hypothetical protein
MQTVESLPKVQTSGTLIRLGGKPQFVIHSLLEKAAEAATKFKLQEEDVFIKVIISPEEWPVKTRRMLGYLYGHLAPAAQDFFYEAGWSHVTTKEIAVDEMKEVIGFTETIVNDKTGQTKTIKKSLAHDDREEVSQFIQDCHQFLVEQGVRVKPPE